MDIEISTVEQNNQQHISVGYPNGLFFYLGSTHTQEDCVKVVEALHLLHVENTRK